VREEKDRGNREYSCVRGEGAKEGGGSVVKTKGKLVGEIKA